MSERDQQIYEKLKREMDERESKKSNRKLLPLITVLFVTSIIAYIFVLNKDEILREFLKDNFEKEEIVLENNQIALHKDFVMGLRLSSLGRYKEAIHYFEKLKYNRLTDEEKEILLHVYIEAKEINKALELDISKDADVVRRLLSLNDLEVLKDLNTKSELISFEIAVLDNDYEKIIELKSAERMEIDERRARAIANAYWQLGETEEALNFTSLMSHDGINMWQYEAKETDVYDKVNANIQSSEGKSKYLILIGLTFILIPLITLFYLNKERIISFDETKKLDKKENNLETTKVQKNRTNKLAEHEKYIYHYED